jgi:transposase
VIAIKTVAHKLARACYRMLREGTDFDVAKAFA